MDWSSWGPAGHDDLTRRTARTVPDVPAAPGTVVEDVASGFTGAVIGIERSGGVHVVVLEDRRGVRRGFPLGGGFWIDGEPVTLVPPTAAAPAAPARTASGSRRVEGARARTARASRIWVEGVHDAAIVEKVWGHDLRVEGVVVEFLEGLDNLPERLAEFQPGPGRRIGVLADHLIEGSKESRLVADVGPHVLVTGHPYVDIWAAVRPERLGLRAWPDVPKGEDWKTGICRRAGWSDPREGWSRVYNAVETFRDLDHTLIGAVERLVDFVTTPELPKESF